MTKDLAILVSPDTKWMNTEDFLNCLDVNSAKKTCLNLLSNA